MKARESHAIGLMEWWSWCLACPELLFLDGERLNVVRGVLGANFRR